MLVAKAGRLDLGAVDCEAVVVQELLVQVRRERRVFNARLEANVVGETGKISIGGERNQRAWRLQQQKNSQHDMPRCTWRSKVAGASH